MARSEDFIVRSLWNGLGDNVQGNPTWMGGTKTKILLNDFLFSPLSANFWGMQPACVPLTTILCTEAYLVYRTFQRRWGVFVLTKDMSKGRSDLFPAPQTYFFLPATSALPVIICWAFGRGVS